MQLVLGLSSLSSAMEQSTKGRFCSPGPESRAGPRQHVRTGIVWSWALLSCLTLPWMTLTCFNHRSAPQVEPPKKINLRFLQHSCMMERGMLHPSGDHERGFWANIWNKTSCTKGTPLLLVLLHQHVGLGKRVTTVKGLPVRTSSHSRQGTPGWLLPGRRIKSTSTSLFTHKALELPLPHFLTTLLWGSSPQRCFSSPLAVLDTGMPETKRV